MTLLVTDAGFVPDDWGDAFTALAEWTGTQRAVELSSETDAADLARLVDRASEAAPALVRITFPSFADGRGFTLARRLRALGYGGRLRAAGHVIADQYAMARRAGFDEVEIGAELAARQPEGQWRARADWRAHDYQSRLGRRPSNAAS